MAGSEYTEMQSGPAFSPIPESTMNFGERQCPPGTASGDSRCNEINAQVQLAKKAMKGMGKCKPGMSQGELRYRWALWLRLAVARSQSIVACWNGGDADHQRETAEAWRMVGLCQSLIQN
jgi:hypothetical protein